MDDLVARARRFALIAHGDQKYGDRPYSFHLDSVVELLAPFGDDARVVGYLHDVVEDTPVTLETIRAEFGDSVARCVALLTDQPGANRAERKMRTHAKLAAVTGADELALIVKAADRLSNLRMSLDPSRASKLEMYRQEHAAFRKAAYRAGLCDILWKEIDEILR